MGSANSTNRAGKPAAALRAGFWGAVCLAALTLPAVHGGALAQTENLLDRISNERMRTFEERLTNDISAALNRYISHSQYVLSVKVIWNRDVIPAVSAPGISPDRQKLPGFPIFVAAPGTGGGDDSTPPFIRMVVKVLLDETVPEYYERFVRKIVPIVARFDSARGDQVLVLKETFPVRKADPLPPPTLPEKELMKQLGAEPRQAAAASQTPAEGALPQPPVPGRQRYSLPRPGAMEAAQIAYEEGRYTDALRIVQRAFQTAVSNRERAQFLGMEGSVLFTMENEPAARASWRRALVFDPNNVDVQRVMHFLENRLENRPEPGQAGTFEQTGQSAAPREPQQAEQPGEQQ